MLTEYKDDMSIFAGRDRRFVIHHTLSTVTTVHEFKAVRAFFVFWLQARVIGWNVVICANQLIFI